MVYRSATNQLVALAAGSGSFLNFDTMTAAAPLLANIGFVNDNGLTYDPELNACFVDDLNHLLNNFDGTTYSGGIRIFASHPV